MRGTRSADMNCTKIQEWLLQSDLPETGSMPADVARGSIARLPIQIAHLPLDQIARDRG